MTSGRRTELRLNCSILLLIALLSPDIGRAGHGVEDTVDNLTLFAKKVMPALKAYKQPVTEIAAA